jgi:hypothetical protein
VDKGTMSDFLSRAAARSARRLVTRFGGEENALEAILFHMSG